MLCTCHMSSILGLCLHDKPSFRTCPHLLHVIAGMQMETRLPSTSGEWVAKMFVNSSFWMSPTQP
jgi:hypothetical protein